MHTPATTSPALLTKALLRAVEQLGLTADLPQLLSITAEDAQQLRSGGRALDSQSEEWSAATKIVALFRTLVSLLGTAHRARGWLIEPNQTLDASPIDLLRTADAEKVHRYLNAVLKHELRLPPAVRE